MVSQHKGVQPRRVPASTHQLGSTIDQESGQGRGPSDEQERRSYGVIAEVDEANSLVRVDIYDQGRGETYRLGASKRNTKGAFIPLLEPITDIHHRWGALRKGLGVEVRWRGKNNPSAEAVATILTDELSEIFKSGKKEPESNELTTGPYKIFSGGQNTRF